MRTFKTPEIYMLKDCIKFTISNKCQLYSTHEVEKHKSYKDNREPHVQEWTFTRKLMATTMSKKTTAIWSKKK